MIRFENDDSAYLSWLEMNPSGFVVNCDRNPKPSYLILHSATCGFISTSKRSNWTTNDYIKICSSDKEELQKWAKEKVRGPLKLCGCVASLRHPSNLHHPHQMKIPDWNIHNNHSPEIMKAYAAYRVARLNLLMQLGLPGSHRDPLSEFSEWFVALLVEGTLARSRVKEGCDVINADGQRIQVKYVANPQGKWINEHRIYFSKDMDLFALVAFVDLEVAAVLLFPKASLGQVCQSLHKRHPDQDVSLQLTQRNFNEIIGNIGSFEELGVTDLLRKSPQIVP
ncbi:MAG TPA: hypothetical protein VGK02_03095 [Candidatus Aquicultor sp.]|jgi:hypothetical protein